MIDPLAMASDQKLLVNSLVVAWHPQFSDANPPRVVLTASIQVGPNPPIVDSLGATAGTLAVQMDARVAIDLYEKLGALGHSLGWLT